MQRYNRLYYLLDCAIIGREGFEQQARELAAELDIEDTPSLSHMKTILFDILQTIEPIKVDMNGGIHGTQRPFGQKFYHLEQVAKKLGKSVYQVQELIQSGKLNAVDVSDIETESCKYRVLERDLDLYAGESIKQIMGVEEASELWGLAPGTIKNMCAAGKITSRKIGKTWVISKDHPNPKNKKEEE